MDDEHTGAMVRQSMQAMPLMGGELGGLGAVFSSMGNPTLWKEVEKKNYAGIHNYLTTNKEKVDAEMYIGPFVFTGLEWGLWRTDWKMLALFFTNGADPDKNVFDGIMHTHASSEGFEEPEIMSGFDRNDPEPVRGFEGLRLLLNEDDEVGEAFLHLMKYLFRGSSDLKTDYRALAESVDTLSNYLLYSSEDMKLFILSTLLILKSMGLSQDLAVKIVESTVRDTLWMLLETFATRDIDGEGDE